MRNAKTVLGLLRDRSKRGLPLERVYRLLFNRNLYLLRTARSLATEERSRRAQHRKPPMG